MAERNAKTDLEQLLPKPAVLVAWGVVGVFFVSYYWPSITYLLRVWRTQDAYEHGFFVPIFSLFLLWYRRDLILGQPLQGNLWGLPIFAFCAVMGWVANYFNYGSLPEYSMLFFFAGLALFVGGWRALRWSWPSIVFLFFMIPLPGVIQGAASLQLQGIAARGSVFVIQTLGIPAVAIGHAIQVSDSPTPLDVAAVCSGLKMLMLFFAMCVGAAFIVKRPLWEKIVMVVSAAPIAVASNVVRIVTIALVCELARKWPALAPAKNPQEAIDFWVGICVMMPAGLLMLWIEMTLLSKLMIEPLPDRPLIIGKFDS